MPRNTLATGNAHPAPRRHEAPDLLLAFILFAAPVGWALRLLVNYSLASRGCDAIGSTGAHDALAAVLLIDLAAIVLAAVAAHAAFVLWLKTRREIDSDVHRLVHAGEGRTRFLAMCGMVTSVLFALAGIIDALGVVVGPSC